MDMQVTAKRMLDRRRALGLSLRDVAQRAHTSATSIRKWETGEINSIKTETLEHLARALETSPAYLMGWVDDITMQKGIEPIGDLKPVPLIGVVSAGHPILANNTWDEVVMVPNEVRADFAVKIHGDSMINARLFDGDVVFIREQNQVNNGEIAAVLIGDEVTIKRVYAHKDRLELRPENPLYESINVEEHDIDQVKILGRAMSVLGSIK